jgi:hypothetical protein
MARGFDHLSALVKALEKIQKEQQTEDDVIKHSAALSMVFRAINDIIHPGYAITPSLFPEQDLTKFLEGLMNAHQQAVEKKIFPACKCTVCNNNESITRDTDQTEQVPASAISEESV